MDESVSTVHYVVNRNSLSCEWGISIDPPTQCWVSTLKDSWRSWPTQSWPLLTSTDCQGQLKVMTLPYRIWVQKTCSHTDLMLLSVSLEQCVQWQIQDLADGECQSQIWVHQPTILVYFSTNCMDMEKSWTKRGRMIGHAVENWWSQEDVILYNPTGRQPHENCMKMKNVGLSDDTLLWEAEWNLLMSAEKVQTPWRCQMM